MTFGVGEFIGSALWTLGGVVYGAPFSAAMGVLPTQTGDGLSLRRAVFSAREQTDWRLWATLRELFASPQDRRVIASTNDNDVGKLVVFVLFSIWIVTQYLQYVEIVATVMLVASGLTLAMAATVLTVLFFRNVIDGHRAGWGITGTVALAVGGVVVSIFLLHPPLQNVLPAAREPGGVLLHFLPLSMQFIGALICFAVLIGSIGLSVAHVAAALILAGGWGANWLWVFVFWWNRWATSRGFTWGLWIFMGLALALSSGLVATGLQKMSQVELPLPTPSS